MCFRNNKDFREVTLKDDDGKVLLNFAAAYGFRSIQNLVQKMKRGKCPYQFIEVMACPSGCLNGGGQVSKHVLVRRAVMNKRGICPRTPSIRQLYLDKILD